MVLARHANTYTLTQQQQVACHSKYSRLSFPYSIPFSEWQHERSETQSMRARERKRNTYLFSSALGFDAEGPNVSGDTSFSYHFSLTFISLLTKSNVNKTIPLLENKMINQTQLVCLSGEKKWYKNSAFICHIQSVQRCYYDWTELTVHQEIKMAASALHVDFHLNSFDRFIQSQRFKYLI